MTKKKPEQLMNQVELPDSLRTCWNWYTALNNTRSSGFGISPITYSEIWCYFNLLNIEPETWEIDIIKMFDNIAMKYASEQNREQEQAKTKKK